MKTWLAGLLIGLACSTVAAQHHGIETQSRYLQMILGEAYQLWDEPPRQPPKIVFIPEQALNKKACGRDRCPVIIIAAYLDGVIYLRQDWNPEDIMSASYLVHETIHYLQDQSGMMQGDVTCDRRKELEWQAYDLQNRWLMKNGMYMNRYLMIRQTLASANCD